jgi:hypothetical protein
VEAVWTVVLWNALTYGFNQIHRLLVKMCNVAGVLTFCVQTECQFFVPIALIQSAWKNSVFIFAV